LALNLKRNAVFSVAEAAFTACAYFLLFRIVISKLGSEALGVWSLVSAATAMARLGDMGLTAGVNRFVASAAARGRMDLARGYLDTALISVFGIYLAISVVVYPIAFLTLPAFLTGDSLQQGRSLLPYSLATLVVASASSISISAISGLQQTYKRSILSMTSTVVLMAVTYALTARLGITAFGIAQLAQAFFLLIIATFALNKQMPGANRLPAWSLQAFREMLSYSAQVQIGSIAALVYEPLVKVVMAKYGGLGSLATYEVALRLVTMAKNLIVAANQSLVSAFANIVEIDSGKLRALYHRAFRFTLFASILTLTCVILASVGVSLIVFHKIVPLFITMVCLLGIAQCINTIVVPVYMLGLGTGNLRYNVCSHLAMTILGPALGALGGSIYRDLGVVAGISVGLVAGAAILAIGYVQHFRALLDGPHGERSERLQ